MKKLREGFTTGSCAAAAALACCLWLRDGTCPKQVEIVVPEGRSYTPEIIARPDGSCGVLKDSGDDPDITSGMEIVSAVRILGPVGSVSFAAGEGVGIITQTGLKIPVGEPAINPVPREMIAKAVRSVYEKEAVEVTVSVIGGREIAKKTFNPRLGIQGGISILGTSGVVRPMSEEALKDSLYAELKMRALQGKESLLFTFGNQGETAMSKIFPGMCIVQVSNYIGFMLDSALELGIKHLVIGGHPGKLAKVSAGLMQTHSSTGDARREAIVTQLALMGAPIDLMDKVYKSITTDSAIELIRNTEYKTVWNRLAEAAQRYCTLRVRGEIGISIVFADSAGNILGTKMENE